MGWSPPLLTSITFSLWFWGVWMVLMPGAAWLAKLAVVRKDSEAALAEGRVSTELMLTILLVKIVVSVICVTVAMRVSLANMDISDRKTLAMNIASS